MTFRIILACSALCFILYFGAIGRRHPLQLAGISLTFGLLFVFALLPELSTDIAHLVGIGRGVDLAIYIAILFLLSLTFNLYLGQREQAELTAQLARTIARTNIEIPTSIPDDRIMVIMPMFNEAKVITDVLKGLTDEGITTCVIDDGSDDTSIIEVQSLIAQDLPIILIKHPVNLGQGAALRTGFEEALSRQTEIVVTFDSDGQHEPKDALKLIERLKKDHSLDIVLGSRFLGQAKNIPTVKRLILKAAILFTYLTGGPRLTDSHNGLRAIRQRALPMLRLNQPRMAHASELLHLIKFNKLSYIEEAVTINYTQHSLEKGQSIWGALSIVKDLVIARLTRRS